MNISWYGHSCFKIQTKPKRGLDEVIIFTDPFEKSLGLRPPQGQANIVTISHSHSDHSDPGFLKGDPFIIDSPGEYSIKRISVRGIDSFHDDEQGEKRGRNAIFVIESEEIRICHLGDLGHVLTEEQVEKIGEIDILMIPVGGKYTIEPDQAKEVVAQLEPNMIIPMHYKIPGLKLDVANEKPFFSVMGEKVKEKVSKINIKKKELEGMENKIVLMKIG